MNPLLSDQNQEETHLLAHGGQPVAALLALLCVVPSSIAAAPLANSPMEVTGTYRYAYHDPETSAEALTTACREAWRLAVVESPLYRDSTASVVDSTLLRDVADSLVEHHLRDQQIVEQTERGKTVSCRVRGVLSEDSATAIQVQLTGGPAAEGEERNRTLRIVSTREESGVIFIEFQALRRLDWLNTAYQGTLRDSADIMVNFYEESGALLRTERHPARQSGPNQDVMSPGMLGILKVAKPLGATTYRVWLVK